MMKMAVLPPGRAQISVAPKGHKLVHLYANPEIFDSNFLIYRQSLPYFEIIFYYRSFPLGAMTMPSHFSGSPAFTRLTTGAVLAAFIFIGLITAGIVPGGLR
jgi:hypothetical protein